MYRFFLLADDDTDDAELFGEALSETAPELRFERVENGQHVLDYLGNSSNTHPDIIFLDLNMPEMNGWQCLTKLKADPAYQHIPVIMYTTSSYYRDMEIASDLGAEGLITKPNNFRTVKKILHTLATNPGAGMKNALEEIRQLTQNDQ